MTNTLKHTIKNNTITFLLYYIAAVAGMKFINFPPGNLTVIWLPAGIAMGCLITFGKKVLPAVFLASFLSNAPSFIIQDDFLGLVKGLGLGIGIALTDTLQSAIGYFAYKRIIKTYIFANRKNVLNYYFFMVLLPPILTTWIVVLSPYLLGYYEGTTIEILNKIYVITLADVLGIVLVLPLFYSVKKIRSAKPKDILLFFSFIGLLIINMYFGFNKYYPLIYITIPLLTVSIIRFKTIGYSIGLIIFSWYSIYATSIGIGPFYEKENLHSFVNLFIFIISAAFPLSYLFSLINELVYYNAELKNKNNNLTELSDNLEKTIKERTRDLILAKEDAETANKSKSEFLSNMSHEIRTPMNGIMGFIDILSDNETNTEKKEYLSILKTSSKNLLNIINDILDLSKIEAGKYIISKDHLNLYNYAVMAAKGYEELAKNKKIDFMYDFNIAVAEIITDEKILAQILNNLLSNAVKFTDKGHVKLSIETIPENQIKIKVEDTGIGISKDKQDRIFEPFFQGDASFSKKYGGTGLGLQIVKKSVDLLKGTMNVKSEENQGTEFSIIIPYQLTVSTKESKKTVIKNNESTESIHSTIKIISAEDVEINQLLLSRILKDQKWEITQVYNGKELLAALAKEKYDLILMDIQMPEMDGIEATKKIKSNPDYAQIPIIAISAYAFEENIQEIMKSGVNDYISKPIKKKELMAKINKLLTISQVEQ